MNLLHDISRNFVSKTMILMESEYFQKLMESKQTQKLLEFTLKRLEHLQQKRQNLKSRIVNALDVVSREELEQKLAALRKEIEPPKP